MLKRITNFTLVASLVCFCWPQQNLIAQENRVAIQGGTIFTGAGDIIEAGTIIFEGGKIVSLGQDISVPSDIETIDADGLFVTPGYIDAYSHIGLESVPAPLQPYATDTPYELMLFDRENLMNASRPIMPKMVEATESQWLRTGITTVYVSPGAQNLAGGLGVIIKLTGALVNGRAAVSGSFGESALNAFEAPTTRQGMVAILRQKFISAQEDTQGGEDGRVFAQLLSRSLPFRVLVNTPDDILTALRLADEFGLNLVLDSAAGGHVVAQAISDSGTPVVVGPAIVGIGDGGPYEAFAHTPSNASKLYEAGVRVALSTADSGTGRSVAMEAVVAKAHGLPEMAALMAVTSEAASILGIADQTGTLAPGLDADIVIWEGRPISTWAVAQTVIVDGITHFDR